MKYYHKCKACGRSIQNQLGFCAPCYAAQLFVIFACFLAFLMLPLAIFLALTKHIQG